MSGNEVNFGNLKLGINGLGRIGKLTLWHHVGRKFFPKIVVNLGRKAGQSLDDIAHYLGRDTTYGRLSQFLYGYQAQEVISEVDEVSGRMKINGVDIQFLRNDRNPADITWMENDVRLVVDTTGQFLDPNKPENDPKGSLRGHLAAGADKVVLSAPFKVAEGEPHARRRRHHGNGH